MRLPDPFTNPGLAIGFETVKLLDNDPRLRDELPNGKVLETKVSAQYWGIEISYADLLANEFNFLDSFISEYKRTAGYIDVLLPQYEALRVSGNPNACTIAAGQKGNTIVIGAISNITGTPIAGDLFKLSNHAKVYKITSVTKSGSTMTLTLYPDLATTTTSTAKPVFNAILFQTKLVAGETFDTALNNDGVYSGASLKLRESL